RRHLLHIDSSIQGERSISRSLSARAAALWRGANPEDTITYRDLAREPLPHLDQAGALARRVPPEQHTPEQAASWSLSVERGGGARGGYGAARAAALHLRGPEHGQGMGRPPRRTWPLLRAGDRRRAARGSRADRSRRSRRRVRARDATRGGG